MTIFSGRRILWLCAISFLLVGSSQGFHVPQQTRNLSYDCCSLVHNVAKTRLFLSSDSNREGLLAIRDYLKINYGRMNKVLELNDSIWKALGEGGGYTIFVPKNEAFVALGEMKQKQLLDPRNLETSQKVGAYHIISETVTAQELFNAGGVMTLGGEVPIERSVSGGFFGVGGKEDGGVTIGGAKVIKSIELAGGIIHEVDNLVSPNILWRYMDQLRIPGSK